MWKRYRALRRNGVLGINERNIHYVSTLNPRKLIKLVDDKMETKRLALAAGIPSPELYGVVANARDMRLLPELMRHPDGFVIKPAHGSQGNGIIVIEGPLQNDWRLASGGGSRWIRSASRLTTSFRACIRSGGSLTRR